MYEEEKEVADKAPVEGISISDLSKNKKISKVLGKKFIDYRKKWDLANKLSLTTEFPLFLHIELNQECNYRCPHCIIGNPDEVSRLYNKEENLTFEQYKKIVTISVVLKTDDKLSVWSLGDKDSTETELLERFFEGIERYTPVIVSWNGSGFDLPVIHYRSLIHGVVAQRYWENGDDDQSFRWNNYLSRFHSRHTDLMDVLSGYITTARAPLNEIATILGFPGKMGMSGEKVWEIGRAHV